MINIPLPDDNLFERLASKTGLGEFIANFAERLNDEPRAISAAVVAMGSSMGHPANAHARSWARTSDVVAKAIGLETTTALMDAKHEMERLGVNLVGTTFSPTPEVMAQKDPVPQDTTVFSIDEIRARINGMHAMSIDEMKVEIPILAEAA